MYAQGFGVAQDDSEAVQWLRKSAAQNDAYGQAWLGYMYAEGRGTAQDLGEAERWLSKSAEQGYAWAADLLKQIQSKQQIETLKFTEAKVENDFFLLEDNTVSWAGTSNILARFVFIPKRNLKILLTQDWLTIDDGHGNNYEMGRHSALFEKCGYDSNVCLEKDFREYEGGKDVNFDFKNQSRRS